MMRFNGSSALAIRALLVSAVVVTSVATHVVDRAGPWTDPLTKLPDPVHELAATARWLDQYYASPEGLQRQNGILIDGHVDYEAIGAWLVGSYLRERLNGATEEHAKADVIDAIQRSPEWQSKHPNAAPVK